MKTRRRQEEITERARSLRRGNNVVEAMLWNELKGRKLAGYKFVRQFPIGPYFADFLCRDMRLVVEVDGSQHVGNNRDRQRDGYMRQSGYSVIRFWNMDVLKDMDGVCRSILAALEGQFESDIDAVTLRYVQGDDV
jgi:very-short-patch-repair endonuclease